jgi:hypothetical protein
VVGEVMLDGFFELDFAVIDHVRAISLGRCFRDQSCLTFDQRSVSQKARNNPQR